MQIAKGARLTGAARDAMTKRIVRLYGSGKSIRDITRETGRSFGTVHRMLVDSGTQLRPRGRSSR